MSVERIFLFYSSQVKSSLASEALEAAVATPERDFSTPGATLETFTTEAFLSLPFGVLFFTNQSSIGIACSGVLERAFTPLQERINSELTPILRIVSDSKRSFFSIFT